MKKPVLFSFLFLAAAISAAQNRDSVSVIRLSGSSGDLAVQQITVRNDGSAEYTPLGEASGKITVPAGKYEYIRSAKPAEITAAEQLLISGKDPVKAAGLFRKAGENFSRTGWGIYCAVREAEATGFSGKFREAFEKLQQIRQTPVKYEIFRNDILLCEQVLTDLLIRNGSFAEAEKMAEKMMNSADPETACFGFIRRGDICRGKKNPAAARLFYIQASVLFPESAFHPEAMYKTAEQLFLAGDPVFKKYEALMKKQYPKSPFTEKLGTLKR